MRHTHDGALVLLVCRGHLAGRHSCRVADSWLSSAVDSTFLSVAAGECVVVYRLTRSIISRESLFDRLAHCTRACCTLDGNTCIGDSIHFVLTVVLDLHIISVM